MLLRLPTVRLARWAPPSVPSTAEPRDSLAWGVKLEIGTKYLVFSAQQEHTHEEAVHTVGNATPVPKHGALLVCRTHTFHSEGRVHGVPYVLSCKAHLERVSVPVVLDCVC